MSSSKYKLEVSIEQQTPLIHFQHSDPGVSLRPTEVKPKLDRFIHVWLKNKGIEAPGNWYVDKSKSAALNYKMHILSQGKTISTVETSKLFLGNMGKREDNEKYHRVEFSQPQRVRFTCFCEATVQIAASGKDSQIEADRPHNLLMLIELLLPSFFMLNNFGMRTTKGFGSFRMTGETVDVNVDITDFYPVYFYIQYKDCEKPELGDIEVLWALMKSGLNYKDLNRDIKDYYKGFALRYLNKQRIRNDKAFAKEHIIKAQAANPRISAADKEETYRFIRGILGLPGFYEYRDEHRRGRVDIQSDEIKRFASPVVFKLHENRILILPQRIPDAMYSAQFTFRYRNNARKISTPSEDEFEVAAFLSAFADSFNQREDLTDIRNGRFRRTLNKNLIIRKVGV